MIPARSNSWLAVQTILGERAVRKVIYSVGCSLDGYIAGPDGSVDWLNRVASKAIGEDFGMGAFFKSIDTVLMGRKTYEHALKMGMGKDGYTGMKNYIFSRTLPPGERDGVEYVSVAVKDLVAKLRKVPGKNIWLCGGGELARQALAEGIVDEVTLGVTPVLIGAGRPTFPSTFPETDLELIECKQYKAGILGLTYRVLRNRPKANKKPKPVKSKKRSH
jgi:dihydrofolate reductase